MTRASSHCVPPIGWSSLGICCVNRVMSPQSGKTTTPISISDFKAARCSGSPSNGKSPPYHTDDAAFSVQGGPLLRPQDRHARRRIQVEILKGFTDRLIVEPLILPRVGTERDQLILKWHGCPPGVSGVAFFWRRLGMRSVDRRVEPGTMTLRP